MKYKKGDVILVLFPYHEKTQVKIRPALILEVNTETYKICQITSTDLRRKKKKGLWIQKKSVEGKSMNLKLDSFINLSVVINITNSFIIKKIGFYPHIKEI